MVTAVVQPWYKLMFSIHKIYHDCDIKSRKELLFIEVRMGLYDIIAVQ